MLPLVSALVDGANPRIGDSTGVNDGLRDSAMPMLLTFENLGDVGSHDLNKLRSTQLFS